MSEALYLNPKAYQVEIGQTVHCRYSGRPIIVLRKDERGSIWEAIESTHPAWPEFTERYIGLNYREFEPAFVSKARLKHLTNQ